MTEEQILLYSLDQTDRDIRRQTANRAQRPSYYLFLNRQRHNALRSVSVTRIIISSKSYERKGLKRMLSCGLANESLNV